MHEGMRACMHADVYVHLEGQRHTISMACCCELVHAYQAQKPGCQKAPAGRGSLLGTCMQGGETVALLLPPYYYQGAAEPGIERWLHKVLESARQPVYLCAPILTPTMNSPTEAACPSCSAQQCTRQCCVTIPGGQVHASMAPDCWQRQGQAWCASMCMLWELIASFCAGTTSRSTPAT